MKHSSERILTTHVCSPPRPKNVTELIFAKDREEKVVLQECSPVLGRWPPMLDHILGHGGFRDLDPELQQFTVDSGRAP